LIPQVVAPVETIPTCTPSTTYEAETRANEVQSGEHSQRDTNHGTARITVAAEEDNKLNEILTVNSFQAS
jgi:hypothetical protein